MGTSTIIVSIGSFDDRDRILEPIPIGKRHWVLRDLADSRDAWGGAPPDAMLFGAGIPDLAWHDFAEWLESQEWDDPDSIEVLIKRAFTDLFEVWRLSSDGGLVRVLAAGGIGEPNPLASASSGTEGFKSFESSESWTMGWPAGEESTEQSGDLADK